MIFKALNMVFRDENNDREVRELILTTADVNNIVEIVDVFSPFYESTVQLSGSDYPTLSLIHPIFFTLLKQMTPLNQDKPLTKLLKTCLMHYIEVYMDKYILPKEEW